MAEDTGVVLSIHAPYYINLNSKEKKKVEASIQRILDSARVGYMIGARNIVFHAGYYQKSEKQKTFEKIVKHLKAIISILNEDGIEVVLRPETTGKKTQFGNLKEIIEMSERLDSIQPCIDFSHIHARQNGACNSYGEFSEIMRKVESLGDEYLKDMHLHVSGIEYTMKGEKRHLVLDDSDFRYIELLQVLKDFKVRGLVICESPNLEEDAMLLRDAYKSI
jgi:deoxyribonuclease-4